MKFDIVRGEKCVIKEIDFIFIKIHFSVAFSKYSSC